MSSVSNHLYAVVLRLPALPQTVQRSIRALAATEPSMGKVAEIAADPIVSGMLREFAGPASNAYVEDILGGLGVETGLRFVTAASLRPLYASSEFHSVWNHSLKIAEASERVAARCGLRGADAFLAGLVHDLGFLAMSPIPGDIRHRFLLVFDEGWERLRAEEESLGFSHAFAGSMMAREWSFPADVCAAIEHHHGPQRSGSKLAAAIFVAHEISECGGKTVERDAALDMLGWGEDLLPAPEPVRQRALESLLFR